MTPQQLSGLFGGIGQVGAAALPYVLSEDEIGNLRQLGAQSEQRAQEIAQTAAQSAAFQPYTVRFGTSTQQVGPEGLTSMLAEPLANIQGELIGQTQQAMMQPAMTAESLYGQIRGMQTPEEERQRLALENRLATQGRLGVQTAAYGGTPEQLAYQKAVQEAQNQAAFQASQLAPALEQQRIANLGGLLQTAYIPQQQSLAALQPSIDIARIQQAARQGEAEALYRGGIAGLEAQAAAGTAAANVEAARTQALANALSGMFAKPDYKSGTSSFQDIIGDILGTSSTTTNTKNPFGYSGLTGESAANLYGNTYPLSNDEFFDTYGYFRGEA
jgi:hypothetical protein